VAVLELSLDLFKTGEVSLGSIAEFAGIGHLQLKEEFASGEIEPATAEAMRNPLAVFFGPPT